MDRWSVNKEDIPFETNLFRDVFRFYCMFYRGDGSQDYWDVVTEVQDRIIKEYGNDILVGRLLDAVIEDYDEPSRRVKRRVYRL